MKPSSAAKDLKHYPHFDAPISRRNIEKLVADPKRVAENSFFPFIMFVEEWQPYRTPKTGKPKKKTRPIRYGARRDAYIFTHYRRMISEKYEEQLVNLGISDVVIAYRKIKKSNGSGKCNIDFAKDAFDKIQEIGDCIAIAMDISSFFESLDHNRIKSVWCELMGFSKMPDEHYAVFKNITRYRFVDQNAVYRRLGYIGKVKRGKVETDGYLVRYHEMPKQLCSVKEFREKICGESPHYTDLIQKNETGKGVPQGAPISDLIANFYLMDFDVALKRYVAEQGGMYLRYSDDILVILPGGADDAKRAVDFVQSEISRHGAGLEIKDKKTCVVSFECSSSGLIYKHVDGPQGKRGLEYLGFRFDGKKIYVRDSTMSRLHRKIARAARAEVNRIANKNPRYNAADIVEKFNYSLFSQRYCRVKDFEESDDYKTWTFYSYMKRASAIFEKQGDQILRQISRVQRFLRSRVAKYSGDALKRRSKSI